ncbi:helix-turn-helix domain-containing protein [Saccharothrix variisporea]|uniref:Helix-turn-helix protein n=1 Tax=Saccharothrix variisporea TaxID=543527 RepID=A0A495X6A3_9PSEU|nr:helix-turn-helix protein [Saccharothrix variisporea]
MTTPRLTPGRLRPRNPQPPIPTPKPHAAPTTEPQTQKPSPPIEPEDTASTAPNGSDDESILYTAEQAAALLQVRPSWLRRRAAARAVPCRFLGKHLRFTRQDLLDIATASHQPPRGNRSPITRSGINRRPA